MSEFKSYSERFVQGDSARGHVANALALLDCAERPDLMTLEEATAARKRAQERMRLALQAIDAQDRTIRALRIEAGAYARELQAVLQREIDRARLPESA